MFSHKPTTLLIEMDKIIKISVLLFIQNTIVVNSDNYQYESICDQRGDYFTEILQTNVVPRIITPGMTFNVSLKSCISKIDEKLTVVGNYWKTNCSTVGTNLTVRPN